MKDEKQLENKGLGLGGFRFGDKKKAEEPKNKQKEEEKQEEPPAEEPQEKELPVWMDMVLEGIGVEDPEKISCATDDDLREIKGVGKKTLAEIRELYPYNQPQKQSGEVMVRIKPMRGIGGFGQEGWEGPMDADLADQYAADGYLDILE